MDGLHDITASRGLLFRSQPEVRAQRTLRSSIGCVGTGLHSGRRVALTLCPAPAGSGILFHRTDLGVSIPARFDSVVDTRLCTVLGGPAGAQVGTVEHLMAALYARGVDNAVVELDGPEVPVLDGSAAPWLFLLDCAGVQVLGVPARVVQVLRSVRVECGDAFAELRAGSGAGLDLAVSIAFDAPAIGRQALTMALDEDGFRTGLAPARTFVQAHEIAGLRAAGLAQGGSLDNAVVVDGAQVLNPAGLHCPDEFVRHKMLDAVGDLALAGAVLQGRFIGHRSGHALNNRVLRALFADAANWREADVTLPVPAGAADWTLAAA